jgi:hypothetical protein
MPIANSQVDMYQPQNNIMHIKTKDNQLATNHQLGTNMFKSIMDLKMEVKLGKLLQLCPHLRRLLEISIARIKRRKVADVYRFTTSKVKDFDKAMHVVQVRIGKFEVYY